MKGVLFVLTLSMCCACNIDQRTEINSGSELDGLQEGTFIGTDILDEEESEAHTALEDELSMLVEDYMILMHTRYPIHNESASYQEILSRLPIESDSNITFDCDNWGEHYINWSSKQNILHDGHVWDLASVKSDYQITSISKAENMFTICVDEIVELGYSVFKGGDIVSKKELTFEHNILIEELEQNQYIIKDDLYHSNYSEFPCSLSCEQYSMYGRHLASMDNIEGVVDNYVYMLELRFPLKDEISDSYKKLMHSLPIEEGSDIFEDSDLWGRCYLNWQNNKEENGKKKTILQMVDAEYEIESIEKQNEKYSVDVAVTYLLGSGERYASSMMSFGITHSLTIIEEDGCFEIVQDSYHVPEISGFPCSSDCEIHELGPGIAE